MKHTVALMLALASLSAHAETVVARYPVVQVAPDGSTIPPNTIATPAQVDALAAETESLKEDAALISARASACRQATALYSTNYVVTSTVYVQSIGGVPYDPSNQTVRVHSISRDGDELNIVATVAQEPLADPVLDWRVSLTGGGWSNVSASVTSVPLPAGVTNAAAAYLFQLPVPVSGSAYFRVVDNSSGASGSGLWWLVYGGIFVDGRKGFSGMVGANRFVGGILVEPEPL